MNPLDQYPAIRERLYLVQWAVNGIMGAVAVVLTALGQSPLWYIIATGVLNFVWSYTGTVAANNITPSIDAPTHPDLDDIVQTPSDTEL